MELANKAGVPLIAVTELDKLDGGELSLGEVVHGKTDHRSVIDEYAAKKPPPPICLDHGEKAANTF